LTAHEEIRIRELLAPLIDVEPVRLRPVKRKRPVIFAVAVLVVGLVGASIAIADGLDPLSGIEAANRPRTAQDVPSPTLARMVRLFDGSQAALAASTGRLAQRLLPATARMIRQLPDGRRVYVLSTTANGLCILATKAAFSCGPPLTQAEPTTVSELRYGPDTRLVAIGVARDGVRSVSFIAGGRTTTVPVVDNVWFYEGANNAVESVTVHYADGTTKTLAH
jgi:hypothetical protein